MTLIDIAEQPDPVTAPKTRTDLVVEYFRAHPNQWIDGLTFAGFAGAYAWRSRISDARARGLNIENRQTNYMKGGPIKSEYRYVVDAEKER